ncbi:MAG: DapH/DapD/GlmU-related protein [Candidatus Sericytochromatia bacterium]
MILPLLLYEILITIIACLTYGSATFFTYKTVLFFMDILANLNIKLDFLLILSPILVILFLFYLIISIWIIRLITPPLKEGTYDAPNSSMFYIWTIHFTLNRMVSVQPVRNLILYSVNLRYLLFKALGGNISYGCSISADVDLNDLPMISIGKNCVLGASTFITGHFINKEKITFGKIIIEDNVNIGGFSHISPNVTIGENSWVGAESKIAPMVKISKNSKIEAGTNISAGTRI